MRLSVITVTKDDPEGLARTLASLEPLRSAGLEWEHIVVDGSARRFPPSVSEGWPLRWLGRPPRGIYGAMNDGLHTARGEFCWFLNGGDRLRSPEALLAALGAFTPEVQMVCGAADLMDGDRLNYVAYPRRSLRDSLLSGRSLCHQAMLFRRSLFERLGPYREDLPLAGDEEFLIRLFATRERVVCVPERFAYFATDGLSSRFPVARHQEIRSLDGIVREVVRPWDFFRYRLHRRINAAKARLFRWLRWIPGLLALRPAWLTWRRWSLRYR